jgi:hypothetical protein
MPDFIPDSQFVPDAAPTQSTPAPASGPPGFIPDSQFQSDTDKYGSLGQQGLTALESGAGGATLGLSKVAETKLLGVDPKDIQGREAANPTTSTLANMAGGAALIYGTGGIEAPAVAAAEAPYLAAARAASIGSAEHLGPLMYTPAMEAAKAAAPSMFGAGVAGLAAEGAAFGAGNAVDDYALGDPSLNASKVLQNVGMGAAMGVGLGAAFKGVGYALPKATQGLIDSLGKVKDMAIGTEEDPGVIAKILPKDWMQKAWDGWNTGNVDSADTIRAVADNSLSVRNQARAAVMEDYATAHPERLKEAFEDTGMTLEESIAQAHKMADFFKDAVLVLNPKNTAERVSAFSSTPVAKLVKARIDDFEHDVNVATTPLEVHTALSDLATQIDKEGLIKFDTLKTAANQSDQDILMELRNGIRGNLKDENIWGPVAAHYGEMSDGYAAWKNADNLYKKYFMTNGEVNPGKFKTLFNNWNDPSMDLKRAALDEFFTQAQNVAKSSENYSGYQKGAESISDAVEKGAAKNTELAKIAEAMASRPKGMQNGLFGDFSLAGGAHLLGVPSSVVAPVTAAYEAYKAIKNPYQTGANLESTFQKLKVVGDMVQKTSNMISSGAQSIFSNNAVRGAIEAGSIKSNYTKNSNAVRQFANNPESMVDHLAKTTSGIQTAVPNITMGIHQTVSNGVQYLNSKLPRPTTELPMASKWEATPSQKASFNRSFAAVNNPVGVLKQVKNGTVSNEEIQALQAVHPALYKEMQQKVIENMTPAKARTLNYSTKIAVSKFLGSPMDESLMPQVVQSNQAALQNAPQAQAQAQQAMKSKSTQGGLAKLKVSQRNATETQTLEKEE